MNRKGIALIASLLIGVAVFSFVAYTAFDAIGFGRTVINYDETVPTYGTNQTITLSFSPNAQPVVTFWNGTVAYNNVNGTVPTTNLTWAGNTMTVFHWNWSYDNPTGSPYGADTAYLKFNYTSRGTGAKAIAQPVIVLAAVFAMVIVAAAMISKVKGVGGDNRGRKRFP
jgi:hypothetical protein